MKKYSEKDLQNFMENLYKNSNKELKALFKSKLNVQGAILREVSDLFLIYSVENNVMVMTSKQKKLEIKKFNKIINNYLKADAEKQISILYSILNSTVDKTFEFYSYNAAKKDVKTIIDKAYKGKHFSERVWENETDVANHMYKNINDFLNGKINVNKIKKNIEETFNSSAYNAKRLVETEVSRATSEAFNRFAEEVGVKRVRYNAILDSKTCNDCSPLDNKEYDFNDRANVPKHPLCRCYYDIIE